MMRESKDVVSGQSGKSKICEGIRNKLMRAELLHLFLIMCEHLCERGIQIELFCEDKRLP
jgi:hypothetical protein